MDEGGIFLVFLIHSAARCSASSSCSMVIDSLTWFLARVICSLAIRNLEAPRFRESSQLA
jgi:hypothetical protein